MTGERTGMAIELRKLVRDADALQTVGRQHPIVALIARHDGIPRSRRPSARTEAFRAEAGRARLWTSLVAGEVDVENSKEVTPR